MNQPTHAARGLSFWAPRAVMSTLLLLGAFVTGVAVQRHSDATRSESSDGDFAAEVSTTTASRVTEAPSVPTTTTTITPSSEIFVSPDGDDSQAGTLEQPVNSINQAVERSEPGSSIILLPGSYEPVTIIGKHDLVLRGQTPERPELYVIEDGRYTHTASITVEASTNISISGLRVQRSLWGIQVINSADIKIESLQVTDIGQEGIHIREFSTRVRLVNNEIWSTGRRQTGPQSEFEYRKRGEGIYIGTGRTSGDETTDISIIGNHIHHTTGEAIDIKPAVTNVRIIGNTIHDIETHVSGAIVVWPGRRVHPAPNVLIQANVIYNISEVTGNTDGNAIRLSASATVEHNLIWNTSDHGVLADGDFVSSDSNMIRIHGNVFSQTGRDPIGVWDSPNPADTDIAENQLNTDPESFIGAPVIDETGWATDETWEILFGLAGITWPIELEQ